MTAREANEIATVVYTQKVTDEINGIFRAIETQAKIGKFGGVNIYGAYPETKDILKSLGYTITNDNVSWRNV